MSVSRTILLVLAVTAWTFSTTTAAVAAMRHRATWPVYYYGDPKLKDSAEMAARRVARSTVLRSHYPPQTSFLILTGELISGPDYCVASIRITVQSTVPPYLYRSSAGSAHTIWNGVPGACPGEHPSEASRLAIDEFETQLSKEANSPAPNPQ